MALDAADIERLKAAVPADHRPPRDASGRLTNHFSSLDSLRESNALQGSELDRFNYGTAFVGSSDEDAANPNFLLTGGHAIARAVQTERQEREKRKDSDFIFDQVRQQLAQRLADLRAELVAIDERLEQIRQRREQIGDELEALDELTRLKRSGKFDPNDPAHARLARNAKLTPEELAQMDVAALVQRRQQLVKLDSDLDAEWNARMKRRGEVVTGIGQAEAAQKDIELADTDEARLLAERRAQTVLGAQQLGGAAYRTQSQPAKVIAADAVGIAAESEKYNRAAVAGQPDVTRDDIKSFSP
ncbi:hypothetical protein FPZ54_06685 [Sphingomonas suaedae]|uniref:Uncharacterized protein n=1 Tax=Sphingomonas suaedae TaxID=2599297 RepID=A0A518RE40_9SPHN|nr:hypothetical protein [Sphingomonas suaedae]QDX25735.1 hypothetical protein FPZ54_06685 [Sphingomonas suaedae]